jgi:hypothetical protein
VHQVGTGPKVIERSGGVSEISGIFQAERFDGGGRFGVSWREPDYWCTSANEAIREVFGIDVEVF